MRAPATIDGLLNATGVTQVRIDGKIVGELPEDFTIGGEFQPQPLLAGYLANGGLGDDSAYEEGLTQDEIAFYDALAENESVGEAMGNDALKLIAHELLESLQGNVTVDWSRRESARARMRVLVKRILRKHGYPPDMQDGAVQTVLRQAEALSASWMA